MPDGLPLILRAADLIAAGLDDRDLRRRRANGELTTVAPGCFVSTDDWQRLDRHERYRLRVIARMSRLSSTLVASHDSAAVLWGMPCLDGWPAAVHVIDPARDKPLRKGTLVRHADPLDAGDIVKGERFRVTSALRTAVDLTLRDGFVTGLMLFDHGLRHEHFTVDELENALDARSNALRIRAARSALEHASPMSESPGESISRAQMILLGFEPPVLQKQLVDGDREVARVDFWWEGVGVVGEFDGREKYTNPEMRGGRTVEQVLDDEKWRSESLLDRPEVNRVVRWNYAMARRPDELAERLSRAGVPRLRRRRRRGAG